MPSPEMLRFSQLLRQRRPPTLPPLGERRREMETLQARLPLPATVASEDVTVAGRPARWFTAPDSRADHALLYLHGGAYVQGSLDTHRVLMARLAAACRCRVLGLDYRLAPEHPFPAALEDAAAAWHWLLAQGTAPARAMLAGDSAGGGLALAAAMALRDAGAALPAGLVLLSPWTDLSLSGASLHSRAGLDPMLDAALLRDSARDYAGGADLRDARLSPCFGDFHGLPPLLVQVGDAEVLLDDATRVVHSARAAGGSALLQCWEEAFHVFQALPQLPESGDALRLIAAFFDRHAVAPATGA